MSNTVHLDEVTYWPDSCELFERLLELPGAALLDSSHPYASRGRFDILCAAPMDVSLPSLALDAGPDECGEFFQRLGEFHREQFAGIQGVHPDIPFCGGLLGYIGYDCGNGLNRVTPREAPAAGPAALHLNAYDWCVIQDHLLQRSVLVALPQVGSVRRDDLLARLRRPAAYRGEEFRLAEPFQANLDAEAYRAAFETIQGYIHAGDCYQVNLAQRLSAPYRGDPWLAYRALRGEAAAPFSGFIRLSGEDAVLSLSPERFVSLHGNRVETSPIKGTRPRYRDPGADQLAAAELRASEKDRAENLMIVDLLRNDLGRSCVPGSIHVDRLFDVESYPTVHHLVSTVSGELSPLRGPCDLLRDCFPGGSITGAPKRRAMQIIAELEPDFRDAYCGSLFYISADGRMDSNIAIRTLVCRDGEIHCWGGGGIVADSQWQQEYQETWDKVGRFLRVLEEM